MKKRKSSPHTRVSVVRHSGNSWGTKCCPRCGSEHFGIGGTLTREGREKVQCNRGGDSFYTDDPEFKGHWHPGSYRGKGRGMENAVCDIESCQYKRICILTKRESCRLIANGVHRNCNQCKRRKVDCKKAYHCWKKEGKYTCAT